MGLLSLGTPYDWPDAQALADHVRHHGITQFLHLWDNVKHRQGDHMLWGDELEYVVVAFDHPHRNAPLSLRQGEILHELEAAAEGRSSDYPQFHPEYGRFMLETTPGQPFGASPTDLLAVEPDMRLRRLIVRQHLRPNEVPLTVTSYPMLGAPRPGQPFIEPAHAPDGHASQSLFLPDQVINQHVRFPTLTANIRKRRGKKVAINVPIFHDSHTPRPFIDPSIPHRDLFPADAEAHAGAALPDHIYMDAMGFGMGCCCLQATFQACSVKEARTIYDQMIPVAPLLLALTAASPAYRGYLADVDARWNIISAAVDDRTDEEKGLRPLAPGSGRGRMHMNKSRYDSVDSYLSTDAANKVCYNDNPLPVDEGVLARLTAHGLDEKLSRHIAHLFIRDPLVIFSEMVDLDDTQSLDHFENIQSTNWQTLRFKPPPLGGKIGWRVEVRSMEVQITDYENAAFAIFTVLLTRAILSFGLNFYMPISRVDINMQRAQQRDAIHTQRFFFRKDIYRHNLKPHATPPPPQPADASAATTATAATAAAAAANGAVAAAHVAHTGTTANGVVGSGLPAAAEVADAPAPAASESEPGTGPGPNPEALCAALSMEKERAKVYRKDALRNSHALAQGKELKDLPSDPPSFARSAFASCSDSRAISPECEPAPEDEDKEFSLNELVNGSVRPSPSRACTPAPLLPLASPAFRRPVLLHLLGCLLTASVCMSCYSRPASLVSSRLCGRTSTGCAWSPRLAASSRATCRSCRTARPGGS